MANVYDFSSDKIDLYFLLIDSSGSMEDDEDNVKIGLKRCKNSFEKFPEANSIAISISQFSGSFYPSDFKRVRDLDTSYSACGATALYYSIVKGAEYFTKYIEEVTKKTGIIPGATFILFSDGEPCKDPMTEEEGKKAISRLNYAGVTTVFVAFGKAIYSDFGKELGFISTEDVNDREFLIDFLEKRLPNSMKKQSKNYKNLGANFFSKAINSDNSEGYSQTTAQALEDDSWMDAL